MKARVLLVEGDHLARDVISRALKARECEISATDSIAEAKTLMVAVPPDLVIVDARLADAIPFIISLYVAKTRVIALVNTDAMRDQLRLAGIPAVDRRGTPAALSDAIRAAIGVESQLAFEASHHVLIVDDEEDMRRLLSQFLTQRGYITSVARNGIEALQALERTTDIAVVIMDIVMPQYGGLQTLAEIMTRPRPPAVIILTAVSDRAVAERAVSLGAFDYLLKPMDLDELESVVSACIARSEMT